MSRPNSKVLRRIVELENESVSAKFFCGCVHLPLCHHGKFPLDLDRAKRQAAFYLECKSSGLPDIALTCEDLRPRDEFGKLTPKTSRTLQK
jgi:hypothetical protein